MFKSPGSLGVEVCSGMSSETCESKLLYGGDCNQGCGLCVVPPSYKQPYLHTMQTLVMLFMYPNRAPLAYHAQKFFCYASLGWASISACMFDVPFLDRYGVVSKDSGCLRRTDNSLCLPPPPPESRMLCVSGWNRLVSRMQFSDANRRHMTLFTVA